MASRGIDIMSEEQPGRPRSYSVSIFESSGDITLTPTETSPNWPYQPMPLSRGGVGFALRCFVDFIVLAATVPFIVLAIYAAVKNAKPVDEEEWSKLQTAMKLAVTTFPIVFAAVMSRLMRNIATWKLERGISLGHLEQLLGSSSVFGTLSTQLLMGSYNALAVGLFLLWALSPLGGQSSLHIMTTTPLLAVYPKDIYTFNSELPSPFESIGVPLSWLAPQMEGIYLTSLMGPPSVKHSPVDIWGNFKVPLMSQLAFNHTANETGWCNFDAFRKDIPYSSLIGIPAGGLPQKDNATFTLESSYFDVDCYDLSVSDYVEATERMNVSSDHNPSMKMTNRPPILLESPNNTFYGTNGSKSSFTFGIDSYIDWEPGSLAKLRNEGMSRFVKNVTGNEELFFPRKQTLLFQSKLNWGNDSMPNPVAAAYCNIKRIYVESAVTCIGDPSSIRKPQCFITGMRDSQIPHPPADITPFLFAPILKLVADSMGQDMGVSGGYSMTEKYINNTDTPLLVPNIPMELNKLDKAVVSQRLTQVINTYYFGSLFPSAMVGGLDNELPVFTVQMYAEDPFNRTVTGTVTSLVHDLYSTDFAWFSVFLVTGVIMFTAAAISSILACLTTIPDVLGYASTLTRDSLYFPHSRAGSTLDGLTRSKKFRDIKVMLGDVQNDNSVGLLAFSEAQSVVRAKKGKLYQ